MRVLSYWGSDPSRRGGRREGRFPEGGGAACERDLPVLFCHPALYCILSPTNGLTADDTDYQPTFVASGVGNLPCFYHCGRRHFCFITTATSGYFTTTRSHDWLTMAFGRFLVSRRSFVLIRRWKEESKPTVPSVGAYE